MKKGLPIVFLILSYAISSLVIYMALTDTGIFKKRLEAKLRFTISESAKGFEKNLVKCKSITEALAKDPNIKLIFFQSEIGGNKREYITYLSRLRSSINFVYKVILLNPDGSFLISSEYFDREFKEFIVAQKYLRDKDFVFFGSFDILYSISKVYDQRGVGKGYIVVGWYKDLFKQPSVDSKNIKFVQDLILLNFPEKITKDMMDSSMFSKKALISYNLKDYGLTLLLFKSNIGIDILNIIIIILCLIFALLITVWFIITFVSDRKIQVMEEIRDEVLSGVEQSFSSSMNHSSDVDYLHKTSSPTLSSFATEEPSYGEERYKYEEIETDIVPYTGKLAERNVATVEEVFEFLMDRLGVRKVMFMKRTEDGFVEVNSQGFETQDLGIYFTDKVWERFLSRGKAVSIKGDIKELYEIGNRIKDDLFEITIFPILDSFGDVRYLFVVGRRWTENEPGLEVKKEVFSKIKYLIIQ